MRRVPIDELVGSGSALREIAEALRGGAVLAIPTESSYGLAADPRSERGVRRVLEIKGRDAGKALLVLVADRAQLESLGIAASAATLDRFFALWPAPLTAVLPIREPLAASCGGGTLAVRVPAHAKLRAMLRGTGPVTATSLNRAGEPPCADPGDAARRFDGELDLLVDDGAAPGGAASTLLDATVDPPLVLRAGAFPWPGPAR